MSDQIDNDIIFVLGGSRSGKSSWALNYAESNHEKLLFVATAEIFDDEMAERVRIHKKSRGERWGVIEEPLEISDILEKKQVGFDVILVDCITVWLGNIMFKLGKGKAESYINSLLDALNSRSNNIIIVADDTCGDYTCYLRLWW